MNQVPKKRTYNIPVFVPHMGCPHDCVFCNQRKITGVSENDDAGKIRSNIECCLESIERRKSGDSHIEIAFFGGSFTGIEYERQIKLMKIASEYLEKGRIDAIRCSTRPDYINDEILDMLGEYGMSVIELGVQSTDDGVLEMSNRGHSFDDVKRAAECISRHGMKLGLQMMTGLPGDTVETSVKTAEDIISLSPCCVRIYPTLVLEGTRLYELYKAGMYRPFDLETTVELCAGLMAMFERAGIEVIRVGLQTTDNINEKTVIGPYHPALRELCIGRIIRRCIEKYAAPGKVTEVFVPASLVSPAVGHKGENKEYFRVKYNRILKVLANKNLSGSSIRISGKTVDIYS